MTTDFRKQLEEIEVPIPSSAQGLFNAPQTIGTFLGSDLVDAIVKLHEAEVERIRKDAASENRFAGMSDGGVQQLIKNAEYEIARRATIEPKKEGE
jgi:hypothetical protein